ncbi:MAG: hypothetical protein QXN69_00820 [Candidatus Methanomethylicaceae archaeon]
MRGQERNNTREGGDKISPLPLTKNAVSDARSRTFNGVLPCHRGRDESQVSL